MKKILSVVALVILWTVQAAYAQNDAKAKTVLDAVSKKVNGLKSLKANFTFSLTGGKGGNVNDTKKGTISLKGTKYHILLADQEIMCDGKTVWTYNKAAKEVQVTSYNPSEQSLTPAKLLTNFYDKEYKYSYKGERKEHGKSCDVIELTPTDASKKVSKVELLVDKSASMIAGGKYWEKNGNTYQWTVSNFAPNANIPDNLFAWDAKAHPGVETVDLR